eukprot:16614_1
MTFNSPTEESIICSGDKSCDHAIIDTAGSVYCEGSSSCINSNSIRALSIYCLGRWSCKNSNIINTSVVYCSGYQSCELMDFTISNSIGFKVYLLGKDAGLKAVFNFHNCSTTNINECSMECLGNDACNDASVNCYGNCNIHCNTRKACNGLIVKCHDDCNVFCRDKESCYLTEVHCDDYTLCPDGFGWIQASTITQNPSNQPTEQTKAPTQSPINLITEATVFTDVKDNNLIVWILSVSMLVLCLLIVIVCVFYKNKNKKRVLKLNAMETTISKPLIIAIAIGDYDIEPENAEINSVLIPLQGIEKDIQNICSVFGDTLNYEIVPEYKSTDDEHIKINWKEDEIMTLLQEKAVYLNKNIELYDGLIMFISSHGIKDYILTSDYKKISQLAIHRIFSADYPEIRKIPRIVMFDCCAGTNERYDRTRSVITERKITKIEFMEENKTNTGKNGYSKGIEVTDVHSEHDPIWSSDENNPDFQLVIITSANGGFVSKARPLFGSDCIFQFTMGIENNFITGNKKLLYQILDDVQEQLHNNGKELIEYKCNSKMRYIKFIKNNTI